MQVTKCHMDSNKEEKKENQAEQKCTLSFWEENTHEGI